MEDNILEKLEEKLRTIITLRLKIELAQIYEDIDTAFELEYISEPVEELLRDIDDLIDTSKVDIMMDIDLNIELAEESEAEEPWRA